MAGDDAFGVLGPAETAKKQEPSRTEPARKPKKQNYTASLDPEVLERIKDAAYFTPGLTISQIISDGALLYLAMLEEDRGGPIPKREPGAKVQTGRPQSNE